jgi:hypothetical protein
VKDLEPAFHLLLEVREANSRKEPGHNWMTEYALLVWLSMLVLIPFDLKTVDSSMNRDDHHSKLIAR